MSSTKSMTPPLSPVLLAGMAVRPLPLSLLQPALTTAMKVMQRRHPDVFDRLSGLNSPLYLIDPIDLPFHFLLDPDPEYPSLKAIDDLDGIEADATIRGPLLLLIELLEGRIDGDALFFSRDLIVEGDTEAVVALRNAVDGAEINVLSDALSFLGPIAKPAETAVRGAGSLFSRFSKDLEMLRDAAIAPVIRRADAQAAAIRDLEENITSLKKQARRSRKSST